MKEQDSATGVRVSREDFAAVITSLEPDQLSCAKVQSHYPRRRLTRIEMLLFWGLRAYLIFMFGVVLYEVWTGVR